MNQVPQFDLKSSTFAAVSHLTAGPLLQYLPWLKYFQNAFNSNQEIEQSVQGLGR